LACDEKLRATLRDSLCICVAGTETKRAETS